MPATESVICTEQRLLPWVIVSPQQRAMDQLIMVACVF